jgi:hypothetical protein
MLSLPIPGRQLKPSENRVIPFGNDCKLSFTSLSIEELASS